MYCFYDKNEPIGMSIPHIETGTESEGRLFYFGVMPYYRGKGIASGCIFNLYIC